LVVLILSQVSVKNSLFRAGCVIVRFWSVMYLSTLPPKIAHFLASTKRSYFLGFLRHEPPPSASLRADKGSAVSPFMLLPAPAAFVQYLVQAFLPLKTVPAG
ncbi:MAG: hypothetical protein IJA79_10030, partial [Desulfovibrio sp.]|nr:hypothetical protein [Desulfovibrio sp.]